MVAARIHEIAKYNLIIFTSLSFRENMIGDYGLSICRANYYELSIHRSTTSLGNVFLYVRETVN